MSLYRGGRSLVRKLLLRLPHMASEPLNDTLARARRAWMKEMRSYRDVNGMVLLPNYPALSVEHLANCRVLPFRDDILGQIPKGGTCAEIGVLAGEFSQAILDICKPAELHLVDHDLSTHGIARRFQAEVESGIVRLYESDSVEALGAFEDRQFDFIYIDADHSYEAVSSDIAAARRKVREDGLLVFNDYTFRSSAECLPYGVMQAVHEFCIAENWEFVMMSLNWYGYFNVAIRRRKTG